MLRRDFLKTLAGALGAATLPLLAAPAAAARKVTPRLVDDSAAFEDLRKWGIDEIDEVTRREIMSSGHKPLGDPTFIGKSFLLEDETLYIRREAVQLEFFAYETMGESAVLGMP